MDIKPSFITGTNKFKNNNFAYAISNRLDNMGEDYYINDDGNDVKELGVEFKESDADIFRDYELFNQDFDNVGLKYKSYDEDDLLPSNLYNLSYSQDAAATRVIDAPDTILPKIKLLKYNTTINEEAFCSKLMGNTDHFAYKLYEKGLPLETIANLFYSSMLRNNDGSRISDDNLMQDGYSLLKEGYPLEFVVKQMQKAILSNGFLEEKYTKGLLKEIVAFPEHRDIYIKRHPVSSIEYFDKAASVLFEKLYNIADNKEDIEVVIDASKLTRYDGLRFVDTQLGDVASKLFVKNNKRWGENEDIIMKMLKSAWPTWETPLSQRCNKERCAVVNSLLELDMPTEQIIKSLKSV